MKKRFLSFAFLLCVALFSAAAGENPKYIFLFIGDGMSTPQRMIADEFSRALGQGQLAINTLPMHATTRTCSANSLVTDSAAAATAIACGERTNNGRIGMNADGSKKLVSAAEIARDHGKKVGIVTSVTINHATPAGFYAHRKSRSEYYEIGLDLIASNFDYFGGGGVAKYDNKKSPLFTEDIYSLAEKSGYRIAGSRDELLALKPGCGKVLAYGVKDKILPYAIDRDGTIPSLAEFTAKGIELLQDSPTGFFMMVEGGAIDYCGHSNDAASNLREVLAFDEAVKVALDFASKHPGETLIVVTGDHETGGMTMGFAGTGYALYVDRLIHQTCSVENFNKKIAALKKADPELKFEDVKQLLSDSFGFLFPPDDVPAAAPGKNGAEAAGNDADKGKKNPMLLASGEVERLKKAFADKKHTALGMEAKKIISGKAGVGWTSSSHTALPVLTTSCGAKSELFTGFLNNTDIAEKLKSIL